MSQDVIVLRADRWVDVDAGQVRSLEPGWLQRAVSRSLSAARSRAEQRVQWFLDAAFELINEKGATDVLASPGG